MPHENKFWKRLAAGFLGFIIGGGVGFLIGIPIANAYLASIDSEPPGADLMLLHGAAAAAIFIFVEIIVIVTCGLIGMIIFVLRSRRID